jgi:N-(2-amino-2-carboxyethyl)-L-glutamate synthase
MGCARYLREWHRPVRIVAVHTVGSVTFGGPPGRRMIPGLGTSVRPPLLDYSYVDEVLLVEEADTIRACHRLARHGLLFGGSTGTVVSGAMGWLPKHHAPGLTAVAIAPDLGERYLDTVYLPDWVQKLYAEHLLDSRELVAASGRPDPRHRTEPRPARASRRFARPGDGESLERPFDSLRELVAAPQTPSPKRRQ